MKQKIVEGGSQSISETKETSLGGQLLSNGNEKQKHCERKLGFPCVCVRLTLEFKLQLNLFLSQYVRDDKECRLLRKCESPDRAGAAREKSVSEFPVFVCFP